MAWQDYAVPAAPPSPTPGWQQHAIPADQPSPSAPAAAPPSNASSDIAQPDTLPALDPRTATAGDYLLKLHQAASGLGQIGQYGLDYARAAANVYGEGDSTLASLKALYGDITGPTIANVVKQQITGQGRNDLISNLAAERGKTAAAEERLGPPGRFAAGMTGAGPLASVAKGLGSTVAPYVGNWVGGVLGSGATSALATTAGEIGRGENISPRDIGLSTIVGALGGVPGGVVERGSLPTSPTAQSYFDQAKQEYKPLSNLIYDAKNEVHPALDVTDAKNAQRDWSGKRWDDASKTRAEVEALLDKPQLTADDIHQSQKYLRDKVINSPTADPNDQTYAGYYRDKLQEVLENGLPSTGVPQNLPPGVTPSNYAAYVKSKGDFFTGQGKDMQRADVWRDVAGTPMGRDTEQSAGSWLADQAARNAAKKPGVFAEPGSPYFKATTELAKTTAQADPVSWGVKHYLLAPLAFTAAGEGFNALSGGGGGFGQQPWWARLGEEASAGLGIGGGLLGYRTYTAAANAAKQQAAEAALRATIASRTMANPLGRYAPFAAPAQPSNAPLRDALRTVLFSQGARGAY